MTLIVVVDSGPLGLATNPRETPESLACHAWMMDLMHDGARVIIPEIADYEVRRELIRAGKSAGLRRLDTLKSTLEYLPITTEAMLRAAELWAQARNRGTQTADNKALDGDVILAAQALTLGSERVVVATTNVDHL